MKLIENGAIRSFNDADESQHQIVSLDEYLAGSASSHGVLIDNDTDLDDLAPHISKLSLLVIVFNDFADGRGFSIAHRLRQSLGYKNTLWAKGYLIPDQYAMAVQCGIEGILLDEEQLIRQPIEQWQQALLGSPIPYSYQKPLKSNRTVSDDTIDYLNSKYKNLTTEDLLDTVLNKDEMGKIALVSSFGTESAVLLHMLAKHSPDTDVLFLDTGKLFPETLEYQQRLVADFKLTNVKIIRPCEDAISGLEPQGDVFKGDNTTCCEIRKVIPLQNALTGYDTWISGRKSYQSNERSSMQIFERAGQHIKINPLAHWSQEELADYIKQQALPEHPLFSQGYTSVGCAPCTTPVIKGEDPRSGRWRNQNKTECGIHYIESKDISTVISNHY